MYTVNKGPSKFVTKSRPGLISVANHLIDSGGGSSIGERLSAPKPVFHHLPASSSQPTGVQHSVAAHNDQPHFRSSNSGNQQHRSQRTARKHRTRSPANGSISGPSLLRFADPEPAPSAVVPQHDELVAFVQNAWLSIVPPSQCDPTASDDDRAGETRPANGRVVHLSEAPNAALADFGAFDLDTWWGGRLFHNITQNA